mmetsp:Transcript_10584/g.20405  ORF Transcript_10584/g.20405 Transcript_10584/m.20405 type:complete len:142 (-) Transcript_10584:2249-2674(-)
MQRFTKYFAKNSLRMGACLAWADGGRTSIKCLCWLVFLLVNFRLEETSILAKGSVLVVLLIIYCYTQDTPGHPTSSPPSFNYYSCSSSYELHAAPLAEAWLMDEELPVALLAVVLYLEAVFYPQPHQKCKQSNQAVCGDCG